MKSIPSQLYYFLRNRPARRNVFSLVRFLVILAGLITLYSILFHYIMAWEGRSYSWITGYYWTLTVMSTLGFGDITFESDLGKIFSSVVLLSGVIFLLILFPFHVDRILLCAVDEGASGSKSAERTAARIPAITSS
jgi:voltage-gated potassium channel